MTDDLWIGKAWDILSVIGACLAMYVMLKANFDRSSNKEPSWLPEARRIGFFIAASFLIFSAVYDGWHPSIPDLMLLGINVYLLATNALSAYFRKPPHTGSKLHASSNRMENRGMHHANLKDQHRE